MSGYLDAVNAAVAALTSQSILGDIGQDEKALAVLLADVRDARQALHKFEASVEAATARAMTGNRLELPALGIVAERKGGSKRTEWDHLRLAGVVARSYATDTDTGEVDSTLAEVAEHVSGWLLQFAAVSYWRAGKLREVGVDPDGYATVERGRRTVQIYRAAGETP